MYKLCHGEHLVVMRQLWSSIGVRRHGEDAAVGSPYPGACARSACP